MKAYCWNLLSKILLSLVLMIAVSASQAATEYFYDSLGRLVTELRSDGSVTYYQYDANGNVTSINQLASQGVTVISVAPNAAFTGSTITIYGTGFNTNPAQDTVTIGGVAASVTAATLTTLSVTIPAAAVTGPVAVTVAGVTATSPHNLTVLRPTITGLSPIAVSAGTSITLTGTNLNLVPGSTTAAVGSTNVTLGSLTNTQAVFTAPSTSGYVVLNTSYGQATSPAPLVILPSNISPATVASAGLASIDGSAQTLNVNQTGKIGVLEFGATQGQMLSIQLSSVSTSAGITYQVYSPTNTVFASGTVSSTTPSIHLPMIGTTGTYTVTFSTSVVFQFSVLVEANAAITIDGSPVNVASTLPSTSKREIISLTAGDNLGFGISNLVKTNGSPSYPQVSVTLYKPDGTQWGNSVCYTAYGGCDLNFSNAPTTGTYGLVVNSNSTSAEPNLLISFTATVSHDTANSLSAGVPITANLSRTGQNARFTFTGTAGTAGGIQIAATSVAPSGRGVNVNVYKPDGTLWISSGVLIGGYAAPLSFPTTGTYLVFVDPQYGATTNVTATLVNSSGGGLTVDGASQNVSGATYTYTGFSLTAGDNIGVGISNLVKTNGSPSYPQVSATLYKPDGTQWGNTVCYLANGGCDLNFGNAPTTGYYGLIVNTNSGSAEPTVAISYTVSASHDFAATLSPGTPATANLSRVGQNARFTFAGTAGTSAGIQIAATSIVPSGRPLSVSIYAPNGTMLIASGPVYGGYATQISLASTGTYLVYVDPQYGATMNLGATLVNASGGALTVDGASQNVSTTSYAYSGFSLTAGDNIGVAITNLVKTNGSTYYTYVNASVYKPDGSQWGSVTCYVANGGCDLNFSNAPTTGFYGLVIYSQAASSEPNLTISYTATVSHDVMTALSPGVPVSANLSRAGQNGRFTFAGTAGTTATVQITGISTTPSGRSVTLAIYKPDGTNLTSTSATGSYTFNLTNLPTTGTYYLYVDPQYGATASMQITRQ